MEPEAGQSRVTENLRDKRGRSRAEESWPTVPPEGRSQHEGHHTKSSQHRPVIGEPLEDDLHRKRRGDRRSLVYST